MKVTRSNKKVRKVMLLERFSNDCRTTKAKAITPTIHNGIKQRDEPIAVLSDDL